MKGLLRVPKIGIEIGGTMALVCDRFLGYLLLERFLLGEFFGGLPCDLGRRRSTGRRGRRRGNIFLNGRSNGILTACVRCRKRTRSDGWDPECRFAEFALIMAMKTWGGNRCPLTSAEFDGAATAVKGRTFWSCMR